MDIKVIVLILLVLIGFSLSGYLYTKQGSGCPAPKECPPQKVCPKQDCPKQQDCPIPDPCPECPPVPPPVKMTRFSALKDGNEIAKGVLSADGQTILWSDGSVYNRLVLPNSNDPSELDTGSYALAETGSQGQGFNWFNIGMGAGVLIKKDSSGYKVTLVGTDYTFNIKKI